MKPTVSFHRITKLRLTPLQRYDREDGSHFWARDLFIEGDGESFQVGLFANAGPAELLIDTQAEAGKVQAAAQAQPQATAPTTCDTCGQAVSEANLGQQTAETVLCADCLQRAVDARKPCTTAADYLAGAEPPF